MCPFFLASCEIGKFPAVTHQIPKLANIRRRDKTPGDKVVLKDAGNPLGVPFVGFLASNRFHILGVSQNNIAGRFQDVVNGNPILPRGLHAHIFAVILGQPGSTPPQVSCKDNAMPIGGGDSGSDRGLVDIHSTADRVNNFEHNTSPRNSI